MAALQVFHALYALLALLAGCAFYLACAHQRLWPLPALRRQQLRGAAWFSLLLSVLVATELLGLWGGVFASLSALMLTCVGLPYFDACLQAKRSRRHVG